MGYFRRDARILQATRTTTSNKTIALTRSEEIKDWLSSLDKNVTWIAIDDLDMRQYLSSFVWIDKPTAGIKMTLCDVYQSRINRIKNIRLQLRIIGKGM